MAFDDCVFHGRRRQDGGRDNVPVQFGPGFLRKGDAPDLSPGLFDVSLEGSLEFGLLLLGRLTGGDDTNQLACLLLCFVVCKHRFSPIGGEPGLEPGDDATGDDRSIKKHGNRTPVLSGWLSFHAG